jgi:hypothetical protein
MIQNILVAICVGLAAGFLLWRYLGKKRHAKANEGSCERCKNKKARNNRALKS